MIKDGSALGIEIYSSGTTRLTDERGLLARASEIEFSTRHPGGLFGEASFFISGQPGGPWPYKGGQRVVIRNGLATCWEGVITSIDTTANGRRINAAGYWGQLLGKRGVNKPWVDNRIDEPTWVYQTGTTGDGCEQCDLDRYNRMRFIPKGVAWASGDYASVRYSAPYGQTVKYIAYNYDFAEAAQSWELSVWRSTDASAWTQMTNVSGETYTSGTTTVITATGAGSIAVTLATPSRYVEIRFYSRAAQTPIEDGTIYGQVSGVYAYTELPSVTPTSIVTNLAAMVSEISTDTSRIGSNTFAVNAFISAGYEYLASLAARATAYGDASYNTWVAQLIESEATASPNGKPLMALAQQPALTSPRYFVSARDSGVTLPTVSKDTDGVYNWIVVKRRDSLNNADVYLTPDDDAGLTDAASVAAYGRREYVALDVGGSSAGVALNTGKRFLADYKNPRFVANGTLRIRDSLLGPNGQRIAAANVRAGYVVKILDYITDESLTGAGLAFVVSGTRYSHDSRQVDISCGAPGDWLAAWAAQQE